MNEKTDSHVDSRPQSEVGATGGQAPVSAHSPLPWRLKAGNTHVADSWGNTVSMIADLTYRRNGTREQARIETDANAEFIVRCVNSHDALVAALRAFLEKWPDVEKAIGGVFALQYARTHVQYSGPTIAAELDGLRAALAKAEGR